jgi:hypothetical protein
MDMTRRKQVLIALLLATSLAVPVLAQDDAPRSRVSRWDISLELPVWPGLQELQPAAGGSFNSVGFGLGASWHRLVAKFTSSEMLLGVDGWVAATESSVAGNFEDVMVRHFYLGGSMKWMFGDARNLSLDAGLGYHELDMAQVSSDWRGTLEFEHWSKSKAGAFIGGTWDVGAGRPGKDRGLSLGLRVHFVDFGRVYDQDNLSYSPTLGPDAGNLTGPLYMMRIAYSGR